MIQEPEPLPVDFVLPFAPEKQDELVTKHFQEAASFWKDVYQQNTVYAAIHRQRRAAVLSLVKELCLPAGSQVLDIGCGAGSLGAALASQGFNVKAVDRIPEMVSMTARLAEELGAARTLSACVGDIHELAFRDGSFDLVLSIGVLPWLSSYRTPLQEMNRVLRRGGRIILNIDNRWALHRLLDPGMNFMLAPLKRAAAHLLWNLNVRKLRADNTTMSPHRFDKLLGECGFNVSKSVMLGFGPFSVFQRKLLPESLGLRIHHLFQQLCDRGVRPFQAIGAQYIVLAEKQ